MQPDPVMSSSLMQARRRTLLRFPDDRSPQAEPRLCSRYRQKSFLGDLFRGHSVFLLCPGPSLNEMELRRLDERGIVTMAVNNAAVIHRPQLWCCADHPGHFCDAIWYDPGILLKFVPEENLDSKLTVRDDNDQLVEDRFAVAEMPGVLGYKRNDEFVADRWLEEPTFNWGNSATRTDAHGHMGTRSVMYVALKLLFHLGFRRVFLLGCDFRMRCGTQNYAFPQDRSPESVDYNNRNYCALNVRLHALQPYFMRAHFEVYNCTPASRLDAFPRMNFSDAVDLATSTIPRRIITHGMYDRLSVAHGRNADAAGWTGSTQRKRSAIDSNMTGNRDGTFVR